MIARKYRLNRENIDFILKKGKLLKSRFFLIRIVQNSLEFNRFALIVSKKIHKKAVDRNKLRRQIFESIRLNMPLNNLKKSDIVLIPKKKIIY